MTVDTLVDTTKWREITVPRGPFANRAFRGELRRSDSASIWRVMVNSGIRGSFGLGGWRSRSVDAAASSPRISARGYTVAGCGEGNYEVRSRSARSVDNDAKCHLYQVTNGEFLLIPNGSSDG